MKRNKIAKVLYQEVENKWCDATITGECERCGSFVSRSRCGCDEFCEECGAELDWS